MPGIIGVLCGIICGSLLAFGPSACMSNPTPHPVVGDAATDREPRDVDPLVTSPNGPDGDIIDSEAGMGDVHVAGDTGLDDNLTDANTSTMQPGGDAKFCTVELCSD